MKGGTTTADDVTSGPRRLPWRRLYQDVGVAGLLHTSAQAGKAVQKDSDPEFVGSEAALRLLFATNHNVGPSPSLSSGHQQDPFLRAQTRIHGNGYGDVVNGKLDAIPEVDCDATARRDYVSNSFFRQFLQVSNTEVRTKDLPVAKSPESDSSEDDRAVACRSRRKARKSRSSRRHTVGGESAINVADIQQWINDSARQENNCDVTVSDDDAMPVVIARPKVLRTKMALNRSRRESELYAREKGERERREKGYPPHGDSCWLGSADATGHCDVTNGGVDGPVSARDPGESERVLARGIYRSSNCFLTPRPFARHATQRHSSVTRSWDGNRRDSDVIKKTGARDARMENGTASDAKSDSSSSESATKDSRYDTFLDLSKLDLPEDNHVTDDVTDNVKDDVAVEPKSDGDHLNGDTEGNGIKITEQDATRRENEERAELMVVEVNGGRGESAVAVENASEGYFLKEGNDNSGNLSSICDDSVCKDVAKVADETSRPPVDETGELPTKGEKDGLLDGLLVPDTYEKEMAATTQHDSQTQREVRKGDDADPDLSLSDANCRAQASVRDKTCHGDPTDGSSSKQATDSTTTNGLLNQERASPINCVKLGPEAVKVAQETALSLSQAESASSQDNDTPSESSSNVTSDDAEATYLLLERVAPSGDYRAMSLSLDRNAFKVCEIPPFSRKGQNAPKADAAEGQERAALRSGLQRLYQIALSSFTSSEKDFAKIRDLLDLIEARGVRLSDPRLKESFRRVEAEPRGAEAALTFDVFSRICEPSFKFVRSILLSQLSVPGFSVFKLRMQRIYESVKDLLDQIVEEPDRSVEAGSNYNAMMRRHKRSSGANLSFAACTIDGQRLFFGEKDTPHPLNSCASVFNYCLACQQNGFNRVTSHIGAECRPPDKSDFTFDGKGRVWNPFTKAGSFVAVTLLFQQSVTDKRLDALHGYYSQLVGQEPICCDNLSYNYRRNYAHEEISLAYYLSSTQRLPRGASGEIAELVEFYLQSVSTAMTADACSVGAATLANRGRCPMTGVPVVDREVVKTTLKVMKSSFAKQQAHHHNHTEQEVVSCWDENGSILVVVPGVLGLSCFTHCQSHNVVEKLANLIVKELNENFNFSVYKSLKDIKSSERKRR